MKIALAQLNTTVGDLTGNAAKIAAAVAQAHHMGAQLVIPPELALMGYPPRDLLLQPGFVARAWQMLEQLAADLERNLPGGPAVLVGLAEPNPTSTGRPLFNTAALLHGGRIAHRFRKTLLPTYDVFDEDRYFEPGDGLQILELNGWRLGLSICEDIWNDRDFWQHPRYHRDPIAELATHDVQAVLNMSSSPFTVGKQEIRERMFASMARKHHLPIIYCNQIGGNDDLLFDGRSCAFDPDGVLVARATSFEEDLLLFDLAALQGRITPADFTPEAEIWSALVLGTRDYARKCGFQRALLGLSGGIDSALTAAIAAEALGPENVLGVLMPSPYSSDGSLTDALVLSRNLGIETRTIPIAPIMAAFDETLEPFFTGLTPDVTEENIQARIRGNLLMSLSNKTNALLLTTGNKSELAVGYCTLYGDMSGGLAVISDVPKTMVYRLANWLNTDRGRELIPQSTLTKAPSAELRPNQTDQDSLPPYDILDAILQRHVEQMQSAAEIVAAGFDPATVERVLRLVRIAEFKRKQAAPGIKVTDRAFGAGWRMPIAKRHWDVPLPAPA